MRHRCVMFVAVTAAALACAAPQASAATTTTTTAPAYAPLDQPGPPLTVPLAQLQDSLYCQPGVSDARVTPVLLNPATGVTASENYSWNWEPALDALGIPWCAYTAPNNTMGDIQTSGEYIVYAIRTMYAMAHRKIDIIGHSQGGMSMRWALRFWPDTRAMVDDVVGLSGSNHGTTMLSAAECAIGCAPADWEQTYNSPFVEALNSDAETFKGISYTEIWTHTDEVVQPNGSAATASAALHTGQGEITNVPTQQLCPGDVYEHLLVGTIDPVAYALAVDALTHPGPADPARVASKALCEQVFMPGVNPANVQMYISILDALGPLASVQAAPLAGLATGAPILYQEPALACYVYGTCSGADAPSLILSAPKRAKAGSRVHLRVLVQEGSQKLPVSGVAVTLAGHRAVTGTQGDATLVAGPRAGRKYTLTASRQGCNAAAAAVRAVG
jgi:pimeloyl-ACP methyl ester carboxylesterase